ncbi:hypothetical protein F4781DRAFT_427059 [Annulohypoxylon bovei var. microspora]|nr:hypothetical protein F4781DRAFT_427059 [Annulohypoxylon bovei var. microspora]
MWTLEGNLTCDTITPMDRSTAKAETEIILLYLETLPLLYQHNTFLVHAWTRSPGMTAAKLSGKEEVWQAMWRGPGPDALRLFEGVRGGRRGVRRARVVGSIGGFEYYAGWLERAIEREVGGRVEPFRWGAGREFEPGW